MLQHQQQYRRWNARTMIHIYDVRDKYEDTLFKDYYWSCGLRAAGAARREKARSIVRWRRCAIADCNCERRFEWRSQLRLCGEWLRTTRRTGACIRKATAVHAGGSFAVPPVCAASSPRRTYIPVAVPQKAPLNEHCGCHRYRNNPQLTWLQRHRES